MVEKEMAGHWEAEGWFLRMTKLVVAVLMAMTGSCSDKRRTTASKASSP